MSSVLAIISKAVFEKLAPGASAGSVVATDSYASLHKSLDGLIDGGALFLVTVRPPDEQLWLVAVLEQPKRGKTGWSACANQVPIANISKLRSKLVFTTGTGIQAKAGALGMSLQTPRGLTEADEALLRAASGSSSKAASSKAASPKAASSKAASPKAASPKAASPKAASPKAASSKAASPKAASPKAASSKAASPKAASPKAASPKDVSSKAASSNAASSNAGSKAPSSKPPAATTGPVADLEALTKAVAAKNGAAALTAALAAWRVQRSPALADLIDDISKRVSGPPVADQNEFTRIASAKNPLDLGRLLPAVTEMQVNFLPTVAALLSAYPDDPRISAAFSTWVIVPITTSISKQAFWSKMFAKVQQTGDLRLVRTLSKRLGMKHWTQSWWDTYYNHLRRTVTKLEALPPVPPIKLPKLAVAKLSPIATTAVVTTAKAPKTPKAPKLSGPLLAQAATHLSVGRTTAAIDAMIEHWRTSRIPELADLVDRATRLLPTFDLPFAPMADGQDPWLDAFEADPAPHMPQLLLHLALGGAARAKLQVAQLATLPDDPRISYRLAELGNTRVAGKESQYWNTVYETLARHRDVRTFEPTRRKYDNFENTYFYEARPAKRFMAKLCRDPEAAFKTWPLVFDAADQKLFDKLRAQVEAAVTNAEARERDLIAAIAEDRKSNGPREVYADWLLEREHPRGELLMLACKRSRTAAENERLAQLEGSATVLGAIGDLIDDETKLDRGLCRNAIQNYSTTTLCWRSAAQSPMVALIESIAVTEEFPMPEDFTRFTAAATALEKIDWCGRDTIALLDPDHEANWKIGGSKQKPFALRR